VDLRGRSPGICILPSDGDSNPCETTERKDVHRMIFRSAAPLAALAFLAACATAAPAPAADAPTPAASTAMAPLPRDVHSFARPEVARVTHVELDLATDFAAKTISGTASLDVQAAPGANEIVLDTKNLDVRQVTGAAGQPLRWTLGQADSILGRPLTVALPAGTRRIVVRYATSPGAAALQWLSPEQTAGKRHPYLFSQGESILTRTWIPTQDSPGIRQTYAARITVPAELKAVMSAEMLTPQGEAAAGGRRAFRFRLDHPVPPYLIALAVGDIAFRSLGPRTGVYTEPAVLERSASEFAELERFVDAAERLYGPYRWGRYDLLVLPPSFPFGGMENPRLTFATPTVLAGDRSLVSLVAHELAHSWSGNLVTNATWNDFWLNEGFTTYFENRIMEALYGPERAAMLASLGWQDLQQAVKDAGGPAAADTRLHLDLAGRDPDEGTNDIAYEKGAAFLRTIEAAVGRPRWDAYLRSYFDRHAFQPMTTEGFLADLRANLIRGDAALEQRLQLDRWAFQPGIPENAVVPRSGAFARVEAKARAFAQGTSAASLRTSGWSTQEWQHFLGALPERMTPAQLAGLDRAFHLSEQGNSEILFAWLMIAVRHRYEPALPSLERFLTTQGRRKFVRPLFAALMEQGEWGRAHAIRIYRIARPGYHPVTSGSVDAIVK
jgi:leukotriene-A4 hydrolase